MRIVWSPYLCSRPLSSLRGEKLLDGGVVCARAPSLISVREPVVRWLGDMMVDGVIPLGVSVAAARSLEAVHAGVAAGDWRELAAVHRCE